VIALSPLPKGEGNKTSDITSDNTSPIVYNLSTCPVSRNRPMRCLIVVAMAGLAVGSSFGQSPYSWNAASNGNFTDILRWNPNAPSPSFAGGEDFTIGIAGTYTVSLATNATVQNLTLNNATATFSHTAGTLTL
jgi:hypothetical protein